ncbi:MAG: 30S ribosomal protein S13 [Candidatus Aenigmarchaeota archaeon]|nr:30S ribosomal protein S13 [Candidatus Aenigmarchaeota archaeon]
MANKPKDDSIKEEKKTKQTKEEKKPEAKKAIKTMEGVKGIVRFAEADIPGTKLILNALLTVRGVSHSFATAIIAASGIDKRKMIGAISEEEIEKLEDVTRNPKKYKIPEYLFNRRSDPITGENVHVLSSDLLFVKKSDIDSMKKMQCYKGVRHQAGLPCRGQHTRSSFRTGVRMGVVKKKQEPAKAAAPAPEKKK